MKTLKFIPASKKSNGKTIKVHLSFETVQALMTQLEFMMGNDIFEFEVLDTNPNTFSKTQRAYCKQ